MALDPNGLQAATEAFTAAREAGTPIIDTFPAIITAYLQHAGEAEPVGYVDRLSCPTTFSTHEHPGIEMPVFASPHHQAPEGMVLVPREPTEAMRAAGFEQAMDNVGGDVIGKIEVQTYITTAVWRAMIAASPSNQASASADQGGE